LSSSGEVGDKRPAIIDNPEHGTLVELASRGVPSQVVSHVYIPLGLKPPNYKVTGRLRGD
jgi:hypothetical protein